MAYRHFEGLQGARGRIGDGVGVVRLPLQTVVSLTVSQVSNGQELHWALARGWGSCEVVLRAEASGLH